jgi:hypothetical protein
VAIVGAILAYRFLPSRTPKTDESLTSPSR